MVTVPAHLAIPLHELQAWVGAFDNKRRKTTLEVGARVSHHQHKDVVARLGTRDELFAARNAPPSTLAHGLCLDAAEIGACPETNTIVRAPSTRQAWENPALSCQLHGLT